METIDRNIENEPQSHLTLIRERSLTDVIREEIERLIFSNKLNAGDKINEKALAERYSVSRAPIREASRALEQAGLVEIINNRGVFVRRVNLGQVIEIFNIRAALGRLAAYEAARRISESEISALQDLVAELQEVADEEDAEAYLKLNLQLHQKIFDISGNKKLAKLDTDLGKELRLFRLRGLRSGGGIKVSNSEHHDVLNAICSRDAETAGRLFENHIVRGRDRFLASIESNDVK
ncbi:MAG: GntR family transcriptional regulator [Rhizobiaceae bacterium]